MLQKKGGTTTVSDKTMGNRIPGEKAYKIMPEVSAQEMEAVRNRAY